MNNRKQYEELARRPVPDETMLNLHVATSDNGENRDLTEDFKRLFLDAAARQQQQG